MMKVRAWNLALALALAVPVAHADAMSSRGIRAGQVVGSSDRHAAYAVTTIHQHQIYSTLYRNRGIDVETTQCVDPSGRPQYLLDDRQAVKELI